LRKRIVMVLIELNNKIIENKKEVSHSQLNIEF